nr:MAG TPA: hypothetical protein [Caudoviricetes sp.]
MPSLGSFGSMGRRSKPICCGSMGWTSWTSTVAG